MRLFGLIGYPLTHSFSRKYFTEKFEREGLVDCRYELFPIPAIADFREILAHYPSLEGLNVTIPYKKSVLSFLDDASSIPGELGACNCIRIKKEKLQGFNTDIIGFERSFCRKLRGHHTHALILGTGGAAQAVSYVLRKLGIHFVVVSRDPQGHGQVGYGMLNEEMISKHKVIINTTPLGTFPGVQEKPAIPYAAIGPEHYLFDLVYNPSQTQFLKEGIERGATTENGLEMLAIQAEESWRIWNEK